MASDQSWRGSLSDDDFNHDHCQYAHDRYHHEHDHCHGTSSASSSSKNPRTPPNCTFCRNHGLKIGLKGHKMYCKFRRCKCEKCRLTGDHQKAFAYRTRLRRAQALDEERTLQPGETPSPPLPDIASMTSMSSEGSDEDLSMAVSNSNSVKPHSSGMASSSNTQLKQQRLMVICDRFSKQYRYPWEMLPLLYAMMFFVDGDEEKAISKIQEGHAVLEDYTKLYNLNMNSGAEMQRPRQDGVFAFQDG